MDIVAFGLLAFFSYFLLALDFWKKAPYLSVFSGIIFIILGFGILSDGEFTASFCQFNSITANVECVNHVLPLPFSNYLTEAMGVMFILIGLGVILDNIIRYGERYA